MTDLLEGSENVSVHGIFNWILLLAIFSVITVIGNYLGYKHPMTDSLIGMAILSVITLIGVWLERELPFDISSILYISIIGHQRKEARINNTRFRRGSHRFSRLPHSVRRLW